MLATGIGSTGDIWTTDAVNNSVWEIQEDHAGGCETATLHTSETGASGLAATDCAAGKQFGQSALCLAGFYGIASEGDGNLGLAEFAASSVADISTATTTSAVMPETAVGDDAGITGATNVGGTIWYTGFRDGKIWASKGALNPTAVFACADDCGPYGIVTEGSDVWFTEQRDGKVVELDSSGRELLEVSLGNVQPTGIAVGNDGNIWVTEFLTGQVARISVSGGTATVTPFNLPYDARSYPMWISAGPAGSNTIWVTLPYRNEIAVMNS
jgi:streptogramin lyase